jgi:hypothetical protein
MEMTSKIQKKIIKPPKAIAFQNNDLPPVKNNIITKRNTPNVASIFFQSNFNIVLN